MKSIANRATAIIIITTNNKSKFIKVTPTLNDQ